MSRPAALLEPPGGARGARSARTLPDAPPRAVGAFELWLAEIARANLALPAALAALALMLAAPVLGPALAGALAALAVLGAGLALARTAAAARRARAVLERGRRIEARVTAVRLLMPRPGGGARLRVEYAWAGAPGRGVADVPVGANDRAPLEGEPIDLVEDPERPERHVVPAAYGFRLAPPGAPPV